MGLGFGAFFLAFGVLHLQWTREVFWLLTNAFWYFVLPDSLHTEYTPLGHPIGYALSALSCSASTAAILRLLWAAAARLATRR